MSTEYAYTVEYLKGIGEPQEEIEAILQEIPYLWVSRFVQSNETFEKKVKFLRLHHCIQLDTLVELFRKEGRMTGEETEEELRTLLLGS